MAQVDLISQTDKSSSVATRSSVVEFGNHANAYTSSLFAAVNLVGF